MLRSVILQTEKLCFHVYFYACLLFSWTSIDLVHLFHSKNVSFCKNICRCLLFLHVYCVRSVCLFHRLVSYLLSFGQNISWQKI